MLGKIARASVFRPSVRTQSLALLFSLNVVIKWGEREGGTDRASRDGETPKAERVSEASNSQVEKEKWSVRRKQREGAKERE